MATAKLENINAFSHLGLKRRPTYDEVINLIDENETITGNLPDRTATFYKASPEGSFFDGTDAMELLKEQQNRIFQRQMQDLWWKGQGNRHHHQVIQVLQQNYNQIEAHCQ